MICYHECANVTWSMKGPKGPPLSMLVTFLWQRLFSTLKKLQASSILNQTTMVSLINSQLPPWGHTSHSNCKLVVGS
jgi:hypothetical protein